MRNAEIGPTWTPGASNALTSMCRNPGLHQTMRLRPLQELVMRTDGKVMARGALHRIKSKTMCPGVYDVWLEEVNA